jgi:pimeloyl-CoA synthetase
MRLTFHLLVILAFADSLLAVPIPRERKSVSWKKFVPTIAAVAIVGSVLGLVFLGTKADEAYNSIQTAELADTQSKLFTLNKEDRGYLMLRKEHVAEEVAPEDAELREGQDMVLGFHKLEMIDTEGMDRAKIREVRKAYLATKQAFDKAADAVSLKKKLENEVKEATAKADRAKLEATVLWGVDWRNAVNKAKEAAPDNI